MGSEDTQSISRIEEHGDTVTVVTPSVQDFWHPDRKSVVSQEWPDLFVSTVRGDERVRVATATHVGDTDGFHIHGGNGVYADIPLVERELTEAEIAWCEDTFTFGGDGRPETLVEFEMPHPETLRRGAQQNDTDVAPALDARIRDPDRRHDILTSIYERIATEDFRATKLSRWKGYPIDLDPEWDPESSDNDDRDAAHLNDMVSMRKDAHLQDFRDVAGFEYRELFSARLRVLGVHEPWLEDRDLVALDVAGAEGWTYCRACGGIAPADRFLHVERRTDEDRTVRVCDDCAERNSRGYWTEDAVARAQDRRAQQEGGQRRIGGEYV